MRNNAAFPGHLPDPLAEPLARRAAGWSFFQNDFAGAIANADADRQAVRECVVSSIRAVWYIVVYGTSSLALMSMADWRLAIPPALWFAGYVYFLRRFVPQMRALCEGGSGLRSAVMVRASTATRPPHRQLFAGEDEVPTCDDVIDEHNVAIAAHMRLITPLMTLCRR